MIEEGLGPSPAPDLALPRENQSLIRRRPLSEPTIRRFWKKSHELAPAASAILASLHQCITSGEMQAHFPNVKWDARALEKRALF